MQIEYAMNAVKSGSPSVGLKGPRFFEISLSRFDLSGRGEVVNSFRHSMFMFLRGTGV